MRLSTDVPSWSWTSQPPKLWTKICLFFLTSLRYFVIETQSRLRYTLLYITICLSIGTHLRCFHFLAIEVVLLVQVFVWTLILNPFGYLTRSGICRIIYTAILSLTFWWTVTLFSSILNSHQLSTTVSIALQPQHLFFSFIYFIHTNRCGVVGNSLILPFAFPQGHLHVPVGHLHIFFRKMIMTIFPIINGILWGRFWSVGLG